MTFVIKDNFDEGYVRSDFLFDIEGYNFVYNCETVFTDDYNLVTLNYEKLNFILSNYQKLDPVFLEVLHYSNKKDELPLHISVTSKNHRMVNLLLNYMSKINYAAVT